MTSTRTQADNTAIRAGLAAAARMTVNGHLDGLRVAEVRTYHRTLAIDVRTAREAQILAERLGVTAHSCFRDGLVHVWHGSWHGQQVKVSGEGELTHPEPDAENDDALTVLAGEVA